MFRKFFCGKEKEEISREKLQFTDTYVMYVLNTVAGIAEKYVQEIDSTELSLGECTHIVAVLDKIKFHIPESNSSEITLRKFKFPEVIKNIDDADDTLTDTKAFFDYMEAAQELCAVLKKQGVRKDEASLYRDSIQRVVKIIQEISSSKSAQVLQG